MPFILVFSVDLQPTNHPAVNGSREETAVNHEFGDQPEGKGPDREGGTGVTLDQSCFRARG